MKPMPLRLILSAALVALLAEAAPSEVFILKGGGRVEGKLLNPDQSPRTSYVVKTASGVQITIEADQVKQKLHQNPAEIEYEKIRPGYPDTVEGQWAAAQWCLKNHLVPQRKTHLMRIIELDPDHAEARRAIGYSQVGGEWKTQEEVMLERGFRWYKGRWRLPQEIELMDKKNRLEVAEREWFGKIKMWRGWLGTSKGAQAEKNLRGIDDPYAVRALAAGLENEKNQPLRALYIEILAKIGSPAAIEALATCSMEDPVEEVRLTCLDFLKKEKRPAVVAYYVAKLKNKDNRLVRRAAVGLSHMNDPTAVRPLIDALVTTHKYKIIKGSGNPNQQSYSFGGSSSGGVPGFSFGGGGAKIIKRQIANREVLEALVSLTGENLQYNVAAWKTWYTSRRGHSAVDARRN